MAANALASVAAATAAGWKLERVTLVSGSFLARFSRPVAGIQGQAGRDVRFAGEAAVSATADANALANLNNWRNNRYGVDSAAVSTSQTPDSATSPTTQGVVPVLRALVKDRD